MAAPEKPEKACACGAVMKVAAIVLGQRYTCPSCQAESLERTTYEVDGDLGGQDPLVYLARRRVASDETKDVPIGALLNPGAATAPTAIRKATDPNTKAVTQVPTDPADGSSSDLGAPMSDS